MAEYMDPFLYLFVRVSLGLLFFFQAYEKIVRIKLPNVCDEVCRGAREKGVSDAFSRFSVYLTSYIELYGGLLLVLGLFTVPLLFIFGVHLLLLILAFGYLKGVWDMKHVFPRMILLIILLFMPETMNEWSLDQLLYN